MSVLEWLNKFFSTIALIGLVLIAAAAVVFIRLSHLYDPEELVAMVIIGNVAVFLIIKLGSRVLRAARRSLGQRGFNVENIVERIMAKLFRRRPRYIFNWFDTITRDFRPGRRKWDLPIGINEHGALIESFMLHRNAHMIINGATGSGKSVLTNQIIIAAAMSGLWQVVIICRTPKDYQCVKDMKNVHIVAFDENTLSLVENRKQYADALPRIIESINHEVGRRQDLLTRYKQREWQGIRADVRPPLVLVVLEEFSNASLTIQSVNGPKAQERFLSEVLMTVQEARATGISLLILAQRPDASAVTTNVRAQTASVTFRVRDTTEARIGTGINKSGAETLRQADPKAGVMPEVIFAAAEDVYRLSVPLTDDETLRRAAMYHEQEVRFLGEPVWLYGYNSGTGRNQGGDGPVTGGDNASGGAVGNSQADSATGVDHGPGSVTGSITGYSVTAGFGTNGGGHSAESHAPAVVTGVPVTGSDRDHVVPQLAPWMLARFAGAVHENNPDFRQLSAAFSKQRTIGTFLCLASGMSKNDVMLAIFNGKNARYLEFLNLCERYLMKVQREFTLKVQAEQWLQQGQISAGEPETVSLPPGSLLPS